MKIVNRKKFLRSVIIVITLIILGFIFTGNKTLSHTEIKEKVVCVEFGDTLWNIAKNESNTNIYYKNKDIRYIVEDIKEKNDLQTANILEGQKLIVSCY